MPPTKQGENEMNETMTLITITGDEIELSYSMEALDDIWQEMKTEEWFNIGNWVDCSALYRGQRLEAINMKLIIGYR